MNECFLLILFLIYLIYNLIISTPKLVENINLKISVDLSNFG